MTKRLIIVCLYWLSFGSVFAQPVEFRSPGMLTTLDGKVADFSQISTSPSTATRGSSEACLNVTETLSVDLQNDADNSVINLDIGAGNTFTGLAWDVTLTTIAPSQLNEARLVFAGSDGGPGIILTPGFGQAIPGTMDFSAGMVFDFDDLGFGDPVAGADGILELEFFELAGADNFPNDTDAFWNDAGNAANCSGIRLICTDQTACDVAVLARAPIMGVTPSTLDFGSLVVGSSSVEMTTTINNSGLGTLRINGIEAAGSEFTLSNSGSCSAIPFNLASGASCTFNYIYNPTTPGPVSQQLQIDSNSQGGLITSVTLQGNALQGALSVTPAMLDFGDQLVSTNSGTQVVNLENTGTSTVNVTSIDSVVAPFSVVGGSCSAAPFSITVGSSCTLEYRFLPTVIGVVNQSLVINSDASTEPDTIELQGNGIQPGLSISPVPLDFGSQLVGTTSGAQSLTLDNNGTATVTINSVTAAAAPFAAVGGSCGNTPFSIAVGGSCTIDYSFTPLVVGAASQNLQFASDSPSSPNSVDLLGAGVQGMLNIAPVPLDFGDQMVGVNSAAQIATLSNVGNAPVNITTVAVASAPFANSGGSCGAAPFIIGVGASCTISYTFSPVTTGATSQSLAVLSNAANSPTSIGLQGNGVQGELSVNPVSLDFGDQLVGVASGIQNVVLSNNGTSAINVNSVGAASGAFTRTGGSCGAAPFSIGIGSSCNIGYTFTPSVVGLVNQTIMIASDAAVSPVSADLQGNGVQPSLAVAPSVLDFGDQSVGSSSSAQSVMLSNNGSAAVNINTVTLAMSPFAVSGGSCGPAPFSVAVGASCTIDYILTPNAVGVASQNIVISSDAPSSPDAISLQGNGIQGALTATPSPLDFGEQQVGDTSIAQAITVTNTGTDTVDISSISAVSAPFIVSGGTCGLPPFSLAVGDGCSLGFTFTPSVLGAVSQVLMINSDASGNPNTVELRGEGVNGSLTVTPPNRNFGDQVVGTNSTPLAVTLRNNGTVLVTVNGVSPVVAPFSITGGTCGLGVFTIVPGSTCTLEFTFSPTATGAANQAITVMTNTPTQPNNGVVNLSGNGIQGVLNIGPVPLNFGDQLVGSNSSSQAVTLSNTGTSIVNVSAVGVAAAPFSATGGSCGAAPFSIGIGSNCTLEFTYSPTVTGPANQALVVVSDAATSPDNIMMQGNGIQPELSLAPTPLDFGDQAVNTMSGVQQVTLNNPGTATVNVVSIGAASGAFASAAGSCGGTPFSISAGNSCTLGFTFNPTTSGAANQNIAVVSDAPSSPNNLSLLGNGIQGVLEVAPSPLDFGDQRVTTTSSAQIVTLSNTGTSAINVNAVSAAVAPFAATGGSCGNSPFSIAVGNSCTLIFTFSPSVSGAANQTLMVTSDASSNPDSIDLQGNGTEGALSIAPNQLDFGDQQVGVNSTAQTVTLSNTGTASVDISSISAVTTPFAVSGGSCGVAPFSIDTNASCTLMFTFNPTTAGSASQALTVNSNAPSAPDTINLEGNGIQGQLSINPQPLDFGDQLVGTTSAAQMLTLLNTGTATVNVSAITAEAAPFAAAGGSCGPAPFEIIVGSSCTLAFTFAPSIMGEANQALTVDSDASSSPDSIGLLGNGVQPELTLVPVDFGDVVVGSASDAELLTLSNTGSAILNISAITSAAAPFADAGGSCGAAPFTIAASESCTLSYTFNPTETGVITQTLVVSSDAVTSPDNVDLQGNGTQAELNIAPSPLDFGDQSVGATSDPQALTLSNAGTAILNISEITLATDPFAVSGGTCGASPLSIDAGDSCTIEYNFTPIIAGDVTQTVTVTSDAPSGTDSVDLQGNGIQGELSVAPSPLDFGDQLVGTSSDPQVLTLSNTGNDVVNVSEVTLAADPFALVGGSCGQAPFSIAEGTDCTVEYTFNPTAIGEASQTVMIMSDAPSSPDSIDLLGNGVESALSITPSPLDFGDQQITTTSDTQILTLSNTGTASLTVTDVTTIADPFAVNGGSCGDVPFTIDVGEDCTFELVFSPLVTGAAQQMLTVTSNAPTSPDMVDLQGNGVEAILEVDPELIDFGTLVLSQTSDIQTVLLSSTGSMDVMVDAIDDVASPFMLEGGTCGATPFVLAISTSCTLEYSFTPSRLGASSQILMIDSNNNGDMNAIQLQGIGIAPALAVNPDVLRFAMTDVGNMDGPFTVVVTNIGSAELTLGNLNIQGPASGEFVLDMDGCTASNLMPTDSCSFDVTYVPTRTGIIISAVVSIQGMGVTFDLVDLIAAGSTEDFIFIDGFE